MSRSLLLIGLFLGLSIPARLWSQPLVLLSHSETRDVYELRNDSLSSGAPHELTIPKQLQGESFRILEQRIEQRVVQGIQSNTQTLKPIIEIVGEGIVRKKQVLRLKVYQSRVQGTVEYVTAYLRFEVIKTPIQLRKMAYEPLAIQDHPLANGKWVKIEYQTQGIYEITPEQLNAAGFAVNSIDPRNIQIWGTDAELIPELNADAQTRFEELPIIVSGESDGSFDSNDRIYFYGNSAYRSRRGVNSFGDYRFSHTINYYSTSSYVFLTVAETAGKRMSVANAGLTSTTEVTQFRDHLWKEEELYKTEQLVRSGRQWLGQVFSGESFGRNATIFSDTIPGFIQGSTVSISIRYYARASTNSTFSTQIGEQNLGTIQVTRISSLSSNVGSSANFRDFSVNRALTLSNSILKMDAEFTNTSTGAMGWVDFIDIEVDRELVAERGKLQFYPDQGLNVNQPVTFVLQGFTSQPLVLDVSDTYQPRQLLATYSNEQAQVTYYPNPERQYIAQNQFYRPVSITEIPNQNLTGTSYQPDYLVVTHPDFLEQAQRLAQYREENDNLRTLVATQEQVFNEFSGGNPDIMAIRLFIRHFYDRAVTDEDLPQYVLLFGDTHYDYKNVEQAGSMDNFVFTYESPEFVSRTGSFGSDDFFVLMDANEGRWATTTELIDLGIGRLPVQTAAEASLMVDKIIAYESPEMEFSEWRTLYTFAADDEFPESDLNRDLHVLNADSTAAVIDLNSSGLRLRKIYLFDYPVENTAAGRRVPQATRDLINTINSGTLVINYSGHGAEQVLADERFFVSNMIEELDNKHKPTIFVTATCSFGRFDDRLDQSGAEKLVLHSNGGAIAALTTTRVVFTSSSANAFNFGLNRALTTAMYQREPETGLPRRLGDIYQITKTTGAVGPSDNSRRFILLGDPATRIAMPKRQMRITQVNTQPVDATTPAGINALEEVSVKGVVSQADGSVDVSFNGEVSLQIRDARRFVQLPTERWNGGCYTPNCGYFLQNDVLFNGRATVANGQFEVKFMLPRNVGINSGFSQLLLYATDQSVDATGAYSRLQVSGINTSLVNDGAGPEVDVFLNDDSFVRGSIVNQSPVLVVRVSDEVGINTAASGIGQELVATTRNPDGTQSTYVLNEYFETELNDYRSGEARYSLEQLPEGDYSVQVRAWDIFNNPGEQSTDFTVTNSGDLVIRNVYNYPNPMHSKTRFIIEHNQPNTPISFNLRVFTLTGRPVYHVNEPEMISTGSFITYDWDGRDRDGDKLATGTYLYHIRIKADTPEGRKTVERIEKLVIIQ